MSQFLLCQGSPQLHVTYLQYNTLLSIYDTTRALIGWKLVREIAYPDRRSLIFRIRTGIWLGGKFDFENALFTKKKKKKHWKTKKTWKKKIHVMMSGSEEQNSDEFYCHEYPVFELFDGELLDEWPEVELKSKDG